MNPIQNCSLSQRFSGISQCGILAAVLLCATSRIFAADESVRTRIDQRFTAESAEVPNFRQHVVPLMGKVGCNGRSCHGSFQGQGGFRLSLFGYDFKADHENLLKGEPARVNKATPEESPILKKALLTVDHDGGKRFEKGSWQHRVFLNWIKAGANANSENPLEFSRLEVTPSEIVARKKGETFQLQVTAVWSDGSREDVTPLCRFQSNNDQIGTITEKGLVTSAGPGDTHIVAFYDNGVFPVPMIQPVSDLVGANYPKVPTPTKVDELVIQKLRKLGMVPSDLAGDAEFLRRVSLDMVGTLPTPTEVDEFLASSDPQKRAKKIDELLERPAYAAWWATKLSDFTGNNAKYLNNQLQRNTASREWFEWLQKRIAENTPYDKVVEEIILATSREPGESYDEYCNRMSKLYWKNSEHEFADEGNLIHYWVRSNFRKPDERALGFAYSFLGIRIQCAQCHKHPFDQWTKDDFERFTGFFGRVQYGLTPEGKNAQKKMLEDLAVNTKLNGNDLRKVLDEKLKENKVVPFQELYVVPPAKVAQLVEKGKVDPDKNKKRPVVGGRTAKLLGAEEVSLDELPDPRIALMEWLRDDDNPYFAKAIVNRVWAAYFNVGIVEPPDDLSLANPPSNAPLLQYLATEFVHHKYDLKWLHREIANSRTYQLGWQTNDTNDLDDRNFSHSVPRRIPAEVVVDAIRQSTASDYEMAKWHDSTKGRSIEDGQQARNNNNNYALMVFGRSVRESNCECDRSSEPSLLQTVFLQNDAELLSLISRTGGWVDQILKQGPGVKNAKDKTKTTAESTAQADPAKEELAKTIAAKATPTKETPAEIRKRDERTLDRIRERIAKVRAAGDLEQANRLEARLKEFEVTQAKQANDSVAETGSTPESQTLAKDADAMQIIDSAYLRTVSRHPTQKEMNRSLVYFRENDLRTATRDLLWALLNTKEFVVNH